MNDLLHPCEFWAEPISLAAAGCLAPDEERDAQQHIATCSGCRERWRQLTELCGVLREAQLPADTAEAAVVERVMAAVASDQSRRSSDRRVPAIQHPALVTRYLDIWRWIMRSAVSRACAAVVLVITITGVVWWLPGGGTTPAFADVIAPILEAQTARFKITTELKGPPAVKTTGEVMVLGATRSRQEMAMPDNSKSIMIFDWGRGKCLTLVPATKTAMVVSLANMTKEQVSQQDTFAWFRSVLLDARDKPDVKREPLGAQDVGGRRVVGFRVTSRGMVVSLWGDPKTGTPVRAEAAMALFPNVRTTMSDFVFNVDLDESLFSVEPPAGYTVQSTTVDGSMPEERDLTAAFREYGKLTGGAFPDSLDMQALLPTIAKEVGKQIAVEKLGKKPTSGKDKPDKEPARQNLLAEMPKLVEASTKRILEIQIPLQRGVMFAVLLPADADAHYAGKGVSLGAADQPVFWYRPKDAKKYRVIYADLSVRETDTPPNVPNAQPVPAPLSPND